MSEAQKDTDEQKPDMDGPQEQAVDVPFYYRQRIAPPSPPAAAPASAEQVRKLDRWISKLVIIYGSLFFMLNVIAVMALLRRKYRFVVNNDELINHSLVFSIPALALFILLGLLMLGWSARSRKHIIFSSILATPMFLFFGWLAVVSLNGLLDKGAPMERHALVAGKYKARGSSETTPDYFISVKSWRPDLQKVDLQIYEGLYKIVEPEVSVMKVTTMPGWLGHEWILAYSRLAQ